MNENNVLENEDLKYLENILTHKISKTDIIAIPTFEGNIKPERYFIQYDEIIQSFETGIIGIMGIIASKGKDSKISKYLNYDVMKKIDYWSIYNRQNIDLYEFIRNRHLSEKYNVSMDDLHDIKKMIEDLIYKDNDGMLITLSPPLNMLNAIMNIYADQTASKIIFVAPDKYVHNCIPSVLNFLKLFFRKNDDIPIYVDTYTSTFHEYMKNKTDGFKTFMENDVVITSDAKMIEEGYRNSSIQNVSFVYPIINRFLLVKDLAPILHEVKPTCEYIAYVNKPILKKE